jgi:ketosteroid isomerase-like protein
MKLMTSSIPEELLHKFTHYYSKRDMESILSLFSKDATMFGTGRDEYRVGTQQIKDQLERDWSQSEAGSLRLKRHLHSSKDGISWGASVFEAEITIDGTPHIFDNLRGSVFIEKDDSGEYKISHMHASFPDTEQAEGSSFKEV